jgi:hypothetical protein
LCGLAVKARGGWQRWEAEFGAGRLLGPEGFLAVGVPENIAAAMETVGADFSWFDRSEITARLPFVAAPWETGVFDPLGGSLRIRRALDALARRADIVRGEVISVADDGVTTLADGTVVRGPRAHQRGRPDAGFVRPARRGVRPAYALHLRGSRKKHSGRCRMPSAE